MNTRNNTILITGGGSGIGRGFAEAFHKLGNRVIITGRREAVLRAAAEANPGMAFTVLDTTNPAGIRAAAAQLTAKFPDLNVVINNAGVQRVQNFAADTPFDDAAAQEEIATNISGVIRVTAAFLPHLKSRTASTIINVSSGLAFMPISRFPVYCATKAFVHSFTLSLRHQLRASSVRVIELAPPWVKTDLDANQPILAVPGGMSPMPLPDFIAAAMADLSSDAEELPVAGAKFLHSAGVSPTASAAFRQLNP